MKKHALSYRTFITVVCFLLSLLPLKVEAIRFARPGETLEPPKARYILFGDPLDLTAPDMLVQTGPRDEDDLRYAACDQMPRLYGDVYSYIKHRPISDDPNMYGTVLVHTLINSEGEVEDCIIVETIYDAELVDKLVQKIRTSTFYPAIRDGEPVDVWVGIPVLFTLRNILVIE